MKRRNAASLTAGLAGGTAAGIQVIVEGALGHQYNLFRDSFDLEKLLTSILIFALLYAVTYPIAKRIVARFTRD